MKTKRPIDPYSAMRECIEAVMFLKKARDNLRRAGAPRAASYVARALKSAVGAETHARHRMNRFERIQGGPT